MADCSEWIFGSAIIGKECDVAFRKSLIGQETPGQLAKMPLWLAAIVVTQVTKTEAPKETEHLKPSP